MTTCNFDKAWIGVCGKDNCEEHAQLKCVSCGNPATKQCDETGTFVCGANLCADCEHTIAEDGSNGGIGFFRVSKLPEGYKDHCRKDKQVYKPWYMRKENG